VEDGATVDDLGRAPAIRVERTGGGVAADLTGMETRVQRAGGGVKVRSRTLR